VPITRVRAQERLHGRAFSNSGPAILLARMRCRTSLSWLLCLLTGAQSAQDPVKGSLIASQACLGVVESLPESFPSGNSVFRAVDGQGTPVWNRRRGQLGVLDRPEGVRSGEGKPLTCLAGSKEPRRSPGLFAS